MSEVSEIMDIYNSAIIRPPTYHYKLFSKADLKKMEIEERKEYERDIKKYVNYIYNILKKSSVKEQKEIIRDLVDGNI